jgi:hypothetical protein
LSRCPWTIRERPRDKIRGTAPSQKGGSISELVTQAHGLINAACAGIAASRNEPPASLTLLARMIVSEAKKQRPDDAAIQSIDLEGQIPDWNEVSAAMNIVVKAFG